MQKMIYTLSGKYVSYVILTNLYFRIPKNPGIPIPATPLRRDGKYYLYFAANFMRFTVVKHCENLLRFDEVTADYKAVPFFRTRCIC